jgi:hypothetical protein
MSSQGFRERILEIAEDGSALASSTSQTSLLPTSRLTSGVPLGWFDRIGKAIAFEFSGKISTVVTTPGTLKLCFRLGTVDVFDSGLMTLNIVAQTNMHWTLSGELVCRAIGSGTSTTLFPEGCKFMSHAVIGSPAPTAGGAGMHLLPYNTAPAVGSGFDNGSSQVINLLATWSVSNAANSITLQAGHVDVYSS